MICRRTANTSSSSSSLAVVRRARVYLASHSSTAKSSKRRSTFGGVGSHQPQPQQPQQPQQAICSQRHSNKRRRDIMNRRSSSSSSMSYSEDDDNAVGLLSLDGSGSGGGCGGDDDDEDEEEDADLQRALALSMESATAEAALATASTAGAASRAVDLDNDDYDVDDDDDDDELQQALKLSLMQQQQQQQPQQQQDANNNVIDTNDDDDDDERKPSALPLFSRSQPTQPQLERLQLEAPMIPRSLQQLKPQPTDVSSLHTLLWDPSITVRADQDRWLAQGVHFQPPQEQKQQQQQQQQQHGKEAKNKNNNNHHHHQFSSWGLVQSHGGPCGVLASVQAELLRIILFGRQSPKKKKTTTTTTTTTTTETTTTPQSHGGRLDIPGGLEEVNVDNSSSSNDNDNNLNDILSPSSSLSVQHQFEETRRQALALSVGMVLARAALQPPANNNNTTTSGGGGGAAAAAADSENRPGENSAAAAAAGAAAAEPCVKLVLPNPDLWNDQAPRVRRDYLGPWPDPWRNSSSSSNDGDDGQQSLSQHLVTYTIGPSYATPTSTTAPNTDVNNNSKRYKKHDGSSRIGYNSSGEGVEAETTTGYDDDDDDDDARVLALRSKMKRRSTSISLEDDTEALWPLAKQLAHATARFLLDTNALHWLHVPGGVLLLVLSLVASRSPQIVQSDMDDAAGASATARLTGQFGHCSQELLNLLLTGQAVSNVFDNTLPLGDDLICRGVQSRPAVGYLTQLEALRYLEVGGYYKKPRFPIWVVGSTSHFTVLFGDAAALQESTSDALLEKVRRAFKRQPGAEENGFIQVGQLGDLLKALKLNDAITNDATQTLAASMEVHGAGIILWEDLWKRTSRLLSGASLESVLQGTPNDESSGGGTDPVGMDIFAPEPIAAATTAAAAAPPASDAIMSDEELSRKLQAEWNDDDEVMFLPNDCDTGAAPAVSTLGTFSSSNPPSKSSGAASQSPSSNEAQTTLRLYHYNGLRGGTLTSFEITKQNGEAIGASIALGQENNHAAFGGGSGSLEEVLRTKWPSATFNWRGARPPSID